MTLSLNIQTVSPAAVALTILFVFWLIRHARSSQARAEIARLHAAAEETSAHAEALDQFLGRPHAPQELKDFLLTASDLLEVENTADTVFSELERFAPLMDLGIAPGEAVWNQVQHLAAEDEALFVRVISTAIRAATFRWTKYKLTDDLGVGAVEPDMVKREVYAVARVALRMA